ncbi:hypothetical protein PR048_010680 [Dryococelus australis]|uniref:Uncharacterized protein n=1 Tax=Dryococelus australis TaxID=614101 RepID=A0ABQ9I3C6_9NEOP|nr:hypothetical protein PR048_010680 [Dryococelus australis]
MEQLKPLKPFIFEGDLVSNWKCWKQQFIIYLKTIGRESKEDAVKIATLLHVLCEEAQDLFFTMDISEEEGKNMMEDGESIDTFVTAYRRLSGYESLGDDLIKDLIVCGVSDTRLKDWLLREKEAVGLHGVHYSSRTEGNTSGTSAGDREGYEYGTSHCRTRGNHKGRMVHNTHQAHSNIWGLPEQAVHHQQQKQKTSLEFNSKKDSYTRGQQINALNADVQVEPLVDCKSQYTVHDKENGWFYSLNSTESNVCVKFEVDTGAQLKKELDRMIELGVIAKMTEPTEWLNPIVVVRKLTGNVRVCLDPQPLNAAIMREYCRLPTWEEVTLKMNGAQYFSTLDVNKGFWQIRLAEDSSKLTTFNSSSQGRLRFTWLPHGLSCAPKIFYRVLSTLFQDIEGVQIYIDDIIVFGKDEIEHDKRLERVLQRETDSNVTFNVDNCRFRLKEVKYIGHIIDKEGIKVDPGKVRAITEFPEPGNVGELQRFLGMTTYWTQQHTIAFEHLKTLLTTSPVLQYYDPYDTVTLSVDASQKDLGALLSQSKGPVAYASESLSPAQQNYPQIEKVLLLVVYGCERFHQYIYGRKVLVESDHKPLEVIFSNPLDRSFEMPCEQVVLIPNSSYKSRKLQLNRVCSTPYTCISEYFEELQLETQNDETLNHLKTIIMNGWPSSHQQVPTCVKPYHSFKDELTVHDELVYKGTQIVVPKSMRHTILSKINHMRIQKSKLRAWECVFWPGMCNEIQEDMDKDYLLVVDAYSKYPEFRHLTNLSSTSLITYCKTIMAGYGILETLYSNNGPPFSSREFKEFARLWGINHKTTSPGYPQSNGLVERHVGSPVRVRKGDSGREESIESKGRHWLQGGKESQTHYYGYQSPTFGDLEEQEGNSQEIDNTEPITSANEKGQTTFNTEDGYSDNEQDGS